MSSLIICPSCKVQFEPESAIAQSVKEELRNEYNRKWAGLEKQKNDELKKMEEQLQAKEKEKNDQLRQREVQWKAAEQQKEEQLRQREQAVQQQQASIARQLDEEKKALEMRLTKELAVTVGADYEHKMKLLEETNKSSEAKLAEARTKELDFLKKMQELKNKEQEMELELQRRIIDERGKMAELLKKDEEEKFRLRDTEYQMKLKEKDKQLEDQRRLVEEMKRKSEQGSMQLQGEVQELILEQLLRHTFPFDLVSEVGKGVRGADCILTIRNSFGNECGTIIFESKRTQAFSDDWIDKLKADMRVLKADVAVIVTQSMPKGMECFGERHGIWICTFSEVKPLVHVLRDLVMKVYTAGRSQDNKGDKMTLLYQYLVSTEFSEQWKAIREGFMGMKMSIQKERDQMEKLWKAREKQLEKVLLNAAHIRGSIDGIAGMDVDLSLTSDDSTGNYLLE